MNTILIDLPMPIYTPRLLIRPPQIIDAPAVNTAILESYEALRITMPWAKTKPTLEETEIYLRQASANWILKKDEEPYLPLLIFETRSNAFIGSIGFHHINWEIPSVETGYWVRRSFEKQGFITEATNAITQYAFKQLNANRIAITCDKDNIASQKIPERLHYILEGTLKNHRKNPVTNELSDTLVYAKYSIESLPALSVTWGGQPNVGT